MMVRKTVGWVGSMGELVEIGQRLLELEGLLIAYRGYQEGEIFWMKWLGAWHGFKNVVEVTGQVSALRVFDRWGNPATLFRDDPMSTVEFREWEMRGRMRGPFRDVARRARLVPFTPNAVYYLWEGHVEGFEVAKIPGRMYWYHYGVRYGNRIDRWRYACPAFSA
jgi:hypothetical protein